MPFEIHPAIGVARLGSSQNTASEYFFFGPEPRCSEAEYGDQAFKYDPEKGRVRFAADGVSELAGHRADGKLKRQAVRFRIFDCTREANGKLTSSREIDYASARIEWTIHIANRKGVAYKFTDRNAEPGEKERRNERDRDNGPLLPGDVVITPGRQTMGGKNLPGKELRGSFMAVPNIALAEVKTDDKGRLVVIGPSGKCGSPYGAKTKLDSFVDNDYWYDNTGDGPVLAKLWIRNPDGTESAQDVTNGWVVVAPFDFAPEIDSFVTLYDICWQAWSTKQHFPLPGPTDTSFGSDVLPLLKRVRGYRWVHGPTIRAETQDRHKSWRDSLTQLGDPNDQKGRVYRAMLFAHIAPPDGDMTGKRQVLMPRLHADEPYPDASNDQTDVKAAANSVLKLTAVQYAHLKNWANNQFQSAARATDECSAAALDRIMLQSCSGGAFYPGMEVPRIACQPAIYSAPFRLIPRLDQTGNPVEPGDKNAGEPIDHGLLAGQVTEGLAVPWQADFFECQMERDNAWWPATRPDHVFTKQPAKPVDSQSEEVYRWDEGVSDHHGMVRNWDHLGIVTKKEFSLPDPPVAGDLHDPRVTADFENGKYYYFCEEERDEVKFPHKNPSAGQGNVASLTRASFPKSTRDS